MPARKMADEVAIDGAYQHRALHHGHPVQRFWHESKRHLIDALLEPQPDERILDVGCGSGVQSRHLADCGASVLGLDGNPDAIAFAQEAYADNRLAFRQGYVDELDLPPASFDKAICLEVLEHLYPAQGDALLRGVWRALQPEGLLLISTPNYRSLWPLIEKMLDAFRLVPTLEEAQHVTRYTHPYLNRQAAAAGFHLLAARSICTFGPWLAPVSLALARHLTHWEICHSLPGGTILAHLYQKPSA